MDPALRKGQAGDLDQFLLGPASAAQKVFASYSHQPAPHLYAGHYHRFAPFYPFPFLGNFHILHKQGAEVFLYLAFYSFY